MNPSILTCVATLALAYSAHAAIILQDSFTGANGNLNGRLIEVPQTPGDAWGRSNASDANVQINNNQLVLSLANGFSKTRGAFDDTGLTNPFTLSFDITFNPGADTSTAFYGGLGTSPTNGSSFIDNKLALGFSFGFATGNWAGTTATLWTTRDSGAGNPWDYAGVNGVNANTLTRPDTATPYTANLAVTYNPLTTQAEYFINGLSVATTTYTGAIGGVWFKTDEMTTTTSGFGIDNVMLSTVPEASTYGLFLGIAVVLFAIRARSQRK